MSTTVTGSPPPGQVASQRRSPVGQAAPRTRRGFRLPRASTTPEADLEAAIGADQSVFASNAAPGSDAFTGLEAGIIVLALVMAVGCGWGLTRRLAEYR
jgi:hypothetical protein